MEWLRENNGTCSIVDFLPMAIELKEFMAFQFGFRSELKQSEFLDLVVV
jgi:hypothetical protein